MPHAQADPILHQVKPPRESIFCGKVGGWWAKWVLIMLKFVLKILQDAGLRVGKLHGYNAEVWRTTSKGWANPYFTTFIR